MINFVNHTMMDQESGISRDGGNHFIGAANRDASLTTAENKMKKEIGKEKDDVTKRRLEQQFYLRKVDYD
jgi:hypothetical protein